MVHMIWTFIWIDWGCMESMWIKENLGPFLKLISKHKVDISSAAYNIGLWREVLYSLFDHTFSRVLKTF